MLNTEKLKDWQLEYAFKAAVNAAERAAHCGCPAENATAVAKAALEAQRILNPTTEQVIQKIIS